MLNKMICEIMLGGVVSVVSIRILMMVYFCVVFSFVDEIRLVLFINVSNIGSWKYRLNVMMNWIVSLR